jgi:hypothetical protein
MGFLSPRAPSMPKPDPELAAAQKAQEQRLEAQERDEMMQISARQRARTRGGYRALLSPLRADAEKGVTKEKLGA